MFLLRNILNFGQKYFFSYRHLFVQKIKKICRINKLILKKLSGVEGSRVKSVIWSGKAREILKRDLTKTLRF